MFIIWDALIVGILAVFAVIGYRKGLVATLFGMVGVILAFVLSLSLMSPVGEYIDKTFTHDRVETLVINTLAGSKAGEKEQKLASIDLQKTFGDMSPQVEQLLKMAGVDAEKLLSDVKAGAAAAKKDVVARITDPISAAISKAIAFIALFIVLSLLCVLAAKLLTMVVKLLPLGKKVNQVGGALIGLIKGALIALVFSVIITVIAASANPPKDSVLSVSTVKKTVVMKQIVSITPASELIK